MSLIEAQWLIILGVTTILSIVLIVSKWGLGKFSAISFFVAAHGVLFIDLVIWRRSVTGDAFSQLGNYFAMEDVTTYFGLRALGYILFITAIVLALAYAIIDPHQDEIKAAQKEEK